MRPLFDFNPWASVAMGPWGQNNGQQQQQAAGGTSSGPGSPNAALGPYPDDNTRRMPVSNSISAIQAGRRKRAEVLRRTGRAATRLAGSPGTQTYVNPTVGSTQ